jgi:hypothetical protein
MFFAHQHLQIFIGESLQKRIKRIGHDSGKPLQSDLCGKPQNETWNDENDNYT